VTFKTAVDQSPDLRGAWQVGLRALREADRRRVQTDDSRRIRGSVNVEESLKRKYPAQRQWDYAAGFQPVDLGEEVVYWIEVHPANPGAVKVVLEKFAKLQQWLHERAPVLGAMQQAFVWISSGKTTLSDNQRRRLSLRGLNQTGRFFTIPDTFDV